MLEKQHKKGKTKIKICLLIIILIIIILPSFNSADNNLKIISIVSNQSGNVKDIINSIKNISKIYNFEIKINNVRISDYAYKWAKWKIINKNDYKNLFKILNIFIEEWNKYPVDWSKKSEVQTIAFVKELYVIGQKKPYFIDIDIENNFIFYNIDYCYTGNAFQRYIIHKAFYLLLYENHNSEKFFTDEKWQNLNEEGFEYNKSISETFNTEYEMFYYMHSSKGFVIDYATSSIKEDMSSTYAFMMTGYLYEKLLSWFKDDTILLNKTNFIISFMKNYSDAVNSDYFYKIHRDYDNNSEEEMFHIPVLEDDIPENTPLTQDEVPDIIIVDEQEDTDILIIPVIYEEPMTEDDNNNSLTEKTNFNILLSMIEDDELKKELLSYREDGMEINLDTEDITAEMIIRTAKKYIGTPHKFGGNDKNGIDCSGLIVKAFSEHGISVPRTANEQGRYGELVPLKSQLKRGDMVFFHDTYNTERLITHVGIYLGDNEFIHASSSLGVSITPLDNPYWEEKYLYSTRIFD